VSLGLCCIKSRLVISTTVVISRKKGNVLRYFGMESWKYRVSDAKKQMVSQIGEIKTKFIYVLM
jgi:uncharacterized protein related to proFAR isomerase